MWGTYKGIWIRHITQCRGIVHDAESGILAWFSSNPAENMERDSKFSWEVVNEGPQLAAKRPGSGMRVGKPKWQKKQKSIHQHK